MSDTKLETREPLTNQQRSILITSYNQNPYPSASERHQLVQLTGRTLKQIQDWFANRRRTDLKLISAKSSSISQLPPTATETNYYYCNLPPPMSSICPCCGLTQSFSPMFYSPIN